MKEKILPFRQVEWWLMTILILLIVLTNTLGAKINLDRLANAGSDLSAQYFAYIFIPFSLYGAFYFLHMKILPAYREERRKAKMISYMLLNFFVSWFVVGFFYGNADFGEVPLMPFFFISIVIYFGYLLAVRILDQLFVLTKSTSAPSYNVIRCIIQI